MHPEVNIDSNESTSLCFRFSDSQIFYVVVAFVIEFRGMFQKWTTKSSIPSGSYSILIYHTKIDNKISTALDSPRNRSHNYTIEIPRLTPTSPLHTRYIATVHAMESLRWRRNSFLLPLLMPVVALVLVGEVTTEVTGFGGYLESLTPSSLPSVVTAKESVKLSTTKTTTTTNYLDSLQLRHNNPAEGVVAAATTTTTSPITTDAIASTDYWAAETIAKTPDDHYAKVHPGAGWAGYQHPMYGGYLDNLATASSSSSTTENNSSSSSSNNNNNSSNDNNDGTAAAAATPQDASSTTTTSASCVLEAGKKADYGDDIRWGAQVYLDNLK